MTRVAARVLLRAQSMPDGTVVGRGFLERRACRHLEARGTMIRTGHRNMWRLWQ